MRSPVNRSPVKGSHVKGSPVKGSPVKGSPVNGNGVYFFLFFAVRTRVGCYRNRSWHDFYIIFI